MANIPADLTGRVLGRLTVITRVGSKQGKPLWLCKCRCGNSIEVISTSLTRGAAKGNRVGGTKSCGICRDKDKYPKEHQAWRDMLGRCLVVTHTSYAYYGGRGITVCERWRVDFLNFLEDMGEAAAGLSLDRIDNSGNYTKDNCRWTTWHIQMKNRRYHNQYDH